MRRLIVPALILLSLNGFAQNGLASIENHGDPVNETPAGIISGQVKTVDNQPAAFVTVYLKENNKTTQTDENGYFSLKNLKEGTYTLEISMVGLKRNNRQLN